MSTLVIIRRWSVAAVAAWLAFGCDRPVPEETTLEYLATVPPPSADALAAGDWPSHNRDLAGTRYSPLEQIAADNVADLREAWRYTLGSAPTPDGAERGSELTPLVIAGVLYLAGADHVAALRAATGELLWRYTLERGAPSRGGLAYWPGRAGAAPRVYLTAGRQLVALDAATGKKASAFGTDGEIEMAVVFDGAPTLFENLLIVGSNSAPGSVRAYDARSGAEIWAFRSVPRPGEPELETWQSDAWREQPSLLARAALAHGRYRPRAGLRRVRESRTR